ncbi:hypothetical protein BGZ76_004832 [Entomortierella beljakovae]|nr:hypothetical protein BGZ76_004832 [Entomortierella beljakovae]
MASVSSSTSLPASEDEFLKTLLSLRFKQRPGYLNDLTSQHGDALVPLLRELLGTKPNITSIPIVRLTADESELNADGGNPNPDIDIVPLSFPQSNASKRYIQRDVGSMMAIVLALKGNEQAKDLLVEDMNNPYQVDKKRLVQAIAKCGTDEDILASAANSTPAVRDSLVGALLRGKRKDLANQILGKSRSMSIDVVKVPATTRLRLELEKAKEYDREGVWRNYSKVIDVRNQPGPDMCEPGESFKDVILTLQETYPPLFPWETSRPDTRGPKLNSLIEDSLLTFLKHDMARTMRIIQATSIKPGRDALHTLSIPVKLLSTRQVVKLFTRHGRNENLLRDYWLHLINFDNGVFLKDGTLPYSTLFSTCRGTIATQLVRTAIAFAKDTEFLTVSKTDKNGQINKLKSIFKFAAAGIKNLIYRVNGCSTHEDRIIPTKIFHKTLNELIEELCSTASSSIRLLNSDDTSYNNLFYESVLKQLLHDEKVNPSRSWAAPVTTPSVIKYFPPLVEHLFNQIKDIFKSKTRKDQIIKSLVESLLAYLAPKDKSIFSIPNDGLVRPFSSVPEWDNTDAFNICIANCLNETGKAMIHLDQVWISHFNVISESLTSSQRDDVVRWISALPSFKTLIDLDEGVTVFPMLRKLCTNVQLRHQIVHPLVFCDKKVREVNLGDHLAEWAAYVDIRIPDVRAQFVKETVKPAFEDRLRWITAILNATRMTKDVKEWIKTLKWLLPKIRNEIQPNLVLLAPNLFPDDSMIPRQYLDDATLEEATELAALYSTMDSQNAAAVTPVPGVTHFLNTLATQAFRRFANRPSHPFYGFGCEIPWRRQITLYGENEALSRYTLDSGEPNYSHLISERNEEHEIILRKTLAKETVAKEVEGGSWGLYLVVEGEEEAYVQGKIGAYHSRWLSVKSTLDPDVKGEDLAAFKNAQTATWESICTSLHKDLGWRWKFSPTLVANLEEALDILAKAPTDTYGSDVVLNWYDSASKPSPYDSKDYISSVVRKYTDSWIKENSDKLPWYTRYRALRIQSTQSYEEVTAMENDCILKNGKRDNIRYEEFVVELLRKSPSAIHQSEVYDYLTSGGSYLLTVEQISMTVGIAGFFNQTSTPGPFELFVSKPSMLNPQQCEALKARHITGMVDTATPFDNRVRHAKAFMTVPTTTVEDVANVLKTPSLPARVVEAVLMYLPTLGEPASTLQILMAPVYIQSHLARTAIHAVDNALKWVDIKRIPDYITPLFPPVGERQVKVTVQKEGIRLACANMTLLSDPRIESLIKDLLSRGIRSELHNDVLVVILQSLIGLLCGAEGREDRYTNICEWIWEILGNVAQSEEYRKLGVSYILLAVTPSYRANNKAPCILNNQTARTAQYNATLNDLAKVLLPEYLIGRYVENVLLPMCGEPSEDNQNDEKLIEFRNMTYQVLIQTPGWVTTTNASKLAKEWRRLAANVPLDLDPAQLWRLFVIGVSQCVGLEVQGAISEGKEGNESWQELIGVVQDQVDRFLDRSKTRILRQRALERIHSMSLATNFVTQKFEMAIKAGAFNGDDLDLSAPLLGKAMESVTWKIALQRELTVFKIYDGMSQEEMNEKGLKLLYRIVDLSSRYISTAQEAITWVNHNLACKSVNNRNLKRTIGLALIGPHDELADWVHLDQVAINFFSNQSIFWLSEVGPFVEKLAAQYNAYTYWNNCIAISNILITEVSTTLRRAEYKYTEDVLSTFHQVMAPIVKRARDNGWTKGPDSTIVNKMLASQVNLMCIKFPEDVGSLIHHIIVHNTSTGSKENGIIQQALNLLVGFGSCAISFNKDDSLRDPSSDKSGICTTSVLILEAYMSGALIELDLAPFVLKNNIPLEEAKCWWYPYSGSSGEGEIAKRNDSRENIPQTLKEVDERWKNTMKSNSGYFAPVEKAITQNLDKSTSISPVILHDYRDFAAKTLSTYSRFVLVRPYVFTEFMRLLLTSPSPYLNFSTEIAARQLSDAFTPERVGTGDEYTYNWAPPLSLALDLAEYILHEVRDEAATEGEREAQLIEQTVAMFLRNWLANVVVNVAGKHLAEAEDVKKLAERYSALVEELSADGSGGQSIALQLGDFIPGGFDAHSKVQAFDLETADDDDEGSNYSSEWDS